MRGARGKKPIVDQGIAHRGKPAGFGVVPLVFAKDASLESAGSFTIFPATHKIKWGDYAKESGHIMDFMFQI